MKLRENLHSARILILKLVLIGAELVLGVNTKVVGMDVSFLMSLVSRQKDIQNLSYGQITARGSQ